MSLSPSLSFSPIVQQPPVVQGLLIYEASQSHSDTLHSVELLSTSDQPDAETFTRQHTTHNIYIYGPAGLEPAIPESEMLLAHALDRADRDLYIDTWRSHIPRRELVLWA
jgi:hypothetical protein